MIPLTDGTAFYSAADRSVASSISLRDFEIGLAHAVLLQPALVVPDIFMFISPHLRSHILQSPHGISLFEAAMGEGVILPAFRENFSSFPEVARNLKRTGILGMLSEVDIEDLASRYNVQRGKIFQNPVVWPERMGASYGQTIIDCFSADRDSENSVDESMWRSTRALREEAVAFAVAGLAQDPAAGVRRGDLYNVAGRALGVIGPSETLGDAASILARYEHAGQTGPVPFGSAATYFHWIDDLYRLNQAVRLGAQPTVVGGGPNELAMVESGLLRYGSRDPGAAENSVARAATEFKVDIDLPAHDRLLDLPPNTLLGLRSEGLRWYAAINRYLASPTASNKSAAELEIENYSRRLRMLKVGGDTQRLTIRALATTMAGLTAEAVHDAVGYFGGVDLPPISLATWVASLGYIVYHYRQEAKTDRVTVRSSPYSTITLSNRAR